MQTERKNVILEKTFDLSLKTIEFVDRLESAKKYVIANQLLKSSTSIGANCREAQSAESRADFIHKMKIATKEAEETAYWIELCNASSSYPDAVELLSDVKDIIRVLSKIVSSSRQRSSYVKEPETNYWTFQH